MTDLSAEPYDLTLYRQYSRDYVWSEGIVALESSDSGVSERIPGELLWLFRRGALFDRTVEYPRNWFSVQEQKVKSYSALTQSLFDQCYSSKNYVLQHYETILDIRSQNIAPLDKYQINLPLRN